MARHIADCRKTLSASVADLSRLLADISEKADAAGIEGLESTLSRARRQVDRLGDLRDRMESPSQTGSS
jgi:phage tail tape-measure protein